MAAFDALPRELRDAINYSLFPRGINDISGYLKKGYPALYLAKTIEVQDKEEAQNYGV